MNIWRRRGQIIIVVYEYLIGNSATKICSHEWKSIIWNLVFYKNEIEIELCNITLKNSKIIKEILVKLFINSQNLISASGLYKKM